MDITSYLLGKKSGGGGSTLQDKEVTITENGTTNITADTGYDGLNEVEVTTNVSSDVYYDDNISAGTQTAGNWINCIKRLPNQINSTSTSYANMFKYYRGINIPKIINPNNVTSLNSTFMGCSKVQEIDLSYMDTSNVTDISKMAQNCALLETLNLRNCDFGSVVLGGFSFVSQCTELKNIIWASNYGKGFDTTASENYNNYTLDFTACDKLTHDSLMNIINNLYDIATAGVQTQRLSLGWQNIAKLSQAEIDIATNKGWTVI